MFTFPLSNELSTIHSELSTYWSSPYWWWQRSKRLGLYPIHRAYFRRQSWTPVLEYEWDSLFILDGCRLDLFEQIAPEYDFASVASINSGASATPEWVVRQFSGAITDTIYITANPMVSKHVSAAFYEFHELWRDDHDEAVGTVRPEPVVAKIRSVREEHPDKRIIAHFDQPHYPFLERPDLNYKNSESNIGNVWTALRKGVESRDDVWDAYADNLRAVLDVTVPLANELGEKSVFTADHGNLLGERIWPVPLKEWGHPPGLRHPSLTTVPWATIGQSRIDADQEEVIEDRLRELGYR